MKVARLVGKELIELSEHERSEPAAGSLIVEIDRCGIGGSDVKAWQSGSLPSPAWFGHEWVGRVVEIGAGVSGRFVGERVVGAVPAPCGVCRWCSAGLGEHCDLVLQMILGADRLASAHGAFATMVRVDSRRAHRVPEGLVDNDAALVEPAAVAAHALRRGQMTLGDLVVVIGAGTIGLLVIQLALLGGASAVVAVDPQTNRRLLACSLGAKAAFGSGVDTGAWLADNGHGLGADVVFDCVGSQESQASSVAACRRGGSVVMIGLDGGANLVKYCQPIHTEVGLLSSRGYGISDVRRALDLMAENRLRVAQLHETTVGFGQLSEVFALLASDPASQRKVVFDPRA